jgi:hypothetical protein
LTEHTFSFAATTRGIVTGERRGMNDPIVNWGLLGDRDGLRAYTKRCSVVKEVSDELHQRSGAETRLA